MPERVQRALGAHAHARRDTGTSHWSVRRPECKILALMLRHSHMCHGDKKLALMLALMSIRAIDKRSKIMPRMIKKGGAEIGPQRQAELMEMALNTAEQFDHDFGYERTPRASYC